MSSSLGLWRQANRVEGFQTSSVTDLQTQAKAILALFFPIWNAFPTGFTKATDINRTAISWEMYVNSTNIRDSYVGNDFYQLRSYNNTTVFTFSASYSNSTTNSSTVINVKINNSQNQSYTININPSVTETYCFSPYRLSNCGQNRFNNFTSGDVCMTNQCQNIQSPSTRIKNGTGTINLNLNINWNNQLLTLSFTYNALTISNANINYNIYEHVQLPGIFKIVSIDMLITDFNNIYTALLIDLYTNINTRHSATPTNPHQVFYNEPTFSPAITTTTDRTNAMAGTNVNAVKNTYLNNYLPKLYTAVLAQTKTFLMTLAFFSDLLSVTQIAITADVNTLNELPVNPTNVAQNVITVTTIYNKYNFTILAREAATNATQRFYQNTIIPYRRYLMDTDLMTDIITARTDAVTYFGAAGTTATSAFNTLGVGKTYADIRTQMLVALKQTVSALLTRLNTTYVTWKSYGMVAPSAPAEFDSYVITGWSVDKATVDAATTFIAITAIRDKICVAGTHWPALVAAMQSFTTPRLSMLQNMYTWATQATTTAISANALVTSPATNVNTVGLGVIAPPLIYLQPVVTGTGVSGSARTFYGIVVNNGLASGSTTLTLLGFVWGVTTAPTDNNISATSLVPSGNFQVTQTMAVRTGLTIYVRAYASNKSPAPTYSATNTDIVFSNEIAFTF